MCWPAALGIARATRRNAIFEKLSGARCGMSRNAPPCPVLKKRQEAISRNLPESPTLEKSSQLRASIETASAACLKMSHFVSLWRTRDVGKTFAGDG
jgi:hypothetical protein